MTRPTRLHVTPAQRRRIRELAEAAWPHEACGLVEGAATGPGVRITRVLGCRNLHPDPAHRYEIDPEAFLHAEHAARARGRSVVGVWHSHPHGDPRPSATDRAEAWGGWSYLIAGVTNGAMTDLRAWRLEGETFVEQPLATANEPIRRP